MFINKIYLHSYSFLDFFCPPLSFFSVVIYVGIQKSRVNIELSFHAMVIYVTKNELDSGFLQEQDATIDENSCVPS